jgi:hypothetical protein
MDKSINKTLHGIAIDLQEALKDKLTREHGKFTGAGQASIRVIWDPEESVIKIRMAEYLKYLEFGIPNPTTPEELEDWVRQKMLSDFNPKPVKGKTRSEQLNAAVTAISRNLAEHISLYGPNPYPFIRQTMHQDLQNIINANS